MLKDYVKTAPQFLLPKKTLTQWVGLLANIKTPGIKNRLIRLFIEKYNVDMSEAQKEDPEDFVNFNEFFIRYLKPELRPLAKAKVVSPVDGALSEFGLINEGQIIQAKGHYYTVNELLAGEEQLSQHFMRGSFATFYLSPKDYHRIHMPMDALLTKMVYVPGKLFSVQPATVRIIPQLFARNERLVAFFDTAQGFMAMVLVGATIVGAIGTRWQGEMKRSRGKQSFDFTEKDIHAQQGEEMGYFKLGSTVVLLFSEKQHWHQALQVGSPVRYGQALSDVLLD